MMPFLLLILRHRVTQIPSTVTRAYGATGISLRLGSIYIASASGKLAAGSVLSAGLQRMGVWEYSRVGLAPLVENANPENVLQKSVFPFAMGRCAVIMAVVAAVGVVTITRCAAREYVFQDMGA